MPDKDRQPYTPGLHDAEKDRSRQGRSKVEERILAACEAAGISLAPHWLKFFRALEGDESVREEPEQKEPSATSS
jgi:hypothetical protein